MSIITYPLNGITYDADDVQTYLCTRTSGVYYDTDCFDISITGDMEVTISPGLAWIKNTDFAGKSICSTEDVALTISTGNSSYARTDRIIIRFDKANSVSTIEVVEGTPSSDAAAPDIEQDEYIYELGLYTIEVPKGATELDESYITDTRSDDDVCGKMTDGVTTLEAELLFDQVYAMIEELEAKLEETSGSLIYDESDESVTLA